MKKRIAILGATSHIAKGLIINFLEDKKSSLSLFARAPSRVMYFLKENGFEPNCPINGFRKFERGQYDVIINCIGLGTPSRIARAGGNVLSLTEEFDRIALRYLKKYPKALYINFSSGAVYSVSSGDLKPEHFYGLAKLYQEAKHRVLDKLNIVDVRVFSYFSRFINLDSGYFLTELIKSIKKREVFVTNPRDFTRDFLSSEDLFSLICLVIKAKPFNDVIEAYSSKPVTKFELLDYFVKDYPLKYRIKRKLRLDSPTGQKDHYCSHSRKARDLIGYKPKFSSIETVVKEAKYLIGDTDEKTK